jgi:hypothetical protein
VERAHSSRSRRITALHRSSRGTRGQRTDSAATHPTGQQQQRAAAVTAATAVSLTCSSSSSSSQNNRRRSLIARGAGASGRCTAGALSFVVGASRHRHSSPLLARAIVWPPAVCRCSRRVTRSARAGGQQTVVTCASTAPILAVTATHSWSAQQRRRHSSPDIRRCWFGLPSSRQQCVVAVAAHPRRRSAGGSNRRESGQAHLRRRHLSSLAEQAHHVAAPLEHSFVAGAIAAPPLVQRVLVVAAGESRDVRNNGAATHPSRYCSWHSAMRRIGCVLCRCRPSWSALLASSTVTAGRAIVEPTAACCSRSGRIVSLQSLRILVAGALAAATGGSWNGRTHGAAIARGAGASRRCTAVASSFVVGASRHHHSLPPLARAIV